MPENTPSNGVGETREATNTNLADFDYKSAVGSFAKKSFNDDQIGFYNKVTKKDPEVTQLASDFEAFISNSSNKKQKGIKVGEGNGKISQEKFMEYLKTHTLGLGIGFETKRKKLSGIFGNEYTLSDEKKKTITEELQKKSQFDLEKLLKTQKSREDFLSKLFGKTEKPELKEKVDIFDKMKTELKVSSLTKEQLDAIYAISSGSTKVEPDDIADILPLFQTLEQKQALIKYFLPTISLKKLIDFGVVNKDQAIAVLKKQYKDLLEERGITIEESNLSDYLDTEKLLGEVIIETALFPEEVVDKILKNDNLTNLSDELNEIVEEQQAENREKCKSRKDFEDALKASNKVKGIDNFKEGSVMKTSLVQGKEVVDVFYKIKSFDDENSTFEIVEIGSGKDIYDKDEGDGNRKTLVYNDFLSTLKTKQVSEVEIYDKSTFEEMINNKTNGFRFHTYNYDKEKKEKLETEYKGIEESLQKIIDENITDENTKSKLQLIKNAFKFGEDLDLEDQFSTLDCLIEAEEDEEQKQHLVNFKGILRQLDSKRRDVENFKDDSFERFKEAIDQADAEGVEYGLEVGTCFETEGGLYEITGVDFHTGMISITSAAGTEVLDYTTFLKSFKEQNAKRIKKIDTFDKLKESCFLSDDKIAGKWKNVSLNSKGHLEEKADGNKKARKVEYILGKDGKTLVKITKVSGDRVIVQSGELEEKNKKRTLKVNSKKEDISLQQLAKYVSKKGFEPYFPNPEQEKVEPSNVKLKGGLFGKYWSTFLSASEVIMAGKTYVDTITEYLKRGNELKSAKFAMMFGGLLGDEIQNELRMKVEAANTEQMEKYIDRLSKVDSPIATALIEKWLMDRNTPEYKKEAGLIFMIEKYGSLYTKKMFTGKNHRNDFLWYTALGGKKGDALYMKVKAQAEKEDVQFTEEELIHKLLKQHGDNNIRPSRLHKRYKSGLPKGMGEEIETGKKDGGDPMSIEGRIDGAIGELMGGTYANSVGWLHKIVDKGGSMKQHNTLPFVLLFSGVSHHFDQKISKELNGYLGKGIVLPIAFFLAKPSRTKVFNETVIDLCKEIEHEYPEKKGILKRAQKIRANQTNGSRPTSENISDTVKFWEDYGDVLGDALNMLSLGDGDKYSRTTKLIELKKDENPNYNAYHEIMKVAYANSHFSGSDPDGYMDDAFKNAGISGVDLQKVGNECFKMTPSGGFGTAGNMFWSEVTAEVESIKSRVLSKDPKENRKFQEKLLMGMFRDISYTLLQNNSDKVVTMSDPSKTIGGPLRRWGINLERDFNGYPADKIKDGHADEVIKRLVKNYLDDKVKDNGKSFGIDDVIKKTKLGIDGVNDN